MLIISNSGSAVVMLTLIITGLIVFYFLQMTKPTGVMNWHFCLSITPRRIPNIPLLLKRKWMCIPIIIPRTTFMKKYIPCLRALDIPFPQV